MTQQEDSEFILPGCRTGKYCIRQRQRLGTDEDVKRLIAQLKRKAERLRKKGETLIFDDFDVSETRMTTKSWQDLLTAISSSEIRIERLRAWGCPTLNDKVAIAISDWLLHVPQKLCPFELHLSHCAIATKGYNKLIQALRVNDAFPAPDRKYPQRGLSPLYLRLEKNYIDKAAMQGDIVEGTVVLFKSEESIFSDRIKAKLLVRENYSLQQREGKPPQPEDVPYPKPCPVKGKGKSKGHGKGGGKDYYKKADDDDDDSDWHNQSDDSGPNSGPTDTNDARSQQRGEDPWLKDDPWKGAGKGKTNKSSDPPADPGKGGGKGKTKTSSHAPEPSKGAGKGKGKGKGSSDCLPESSKGAGKGKSKTSSEPPRLSDSHPPIDPWIKADPWGGADDSKDSSTTGTADISNSNSNSNNNTKTSSNNSSSHINIDAKDDRNMGDASADLAGIPEAAEAGQRRNRWERSTTGQWQWHSPEDEACPSSAPGEGRGPASENQQEKPRRFSWSSSWTGHDWWSSSGWADARDRWEPCWEDGWDARWEPASKPTWEGSGSSVPDQSGAARERPALALALAPVPGHQSGWFLDGPGAEEDEEEHWRRRDEEPDEDEDEDEHEDEDDSPAELLAGLRSDEDSAVDNDSEESQAEEDSNESCSDSQAVPEGFEIDLKYAKSLSLESLLSAQRLLNEEVARRLRDFGKRGA